MHIYAEPVNDEQIADIQKTNAFKVEQFEKTLQSSSNHSENESTKASTETGDTDGNEAVLTSTDPEDPFDPACLSNSALDTQASTNQLLPNDRVAQIQVPGSSDSLDSEALNPDEIELSGTEVTSEPESVQLGIEPPPEGSVEGAVETPDQRNMFPEDIQDWTSEVATEGADSDLPVTHDSTSADANLEEPSETLSDLDTDQNGHLADAEQSNSSTNTAASETDSKPTGVKKQLLGMTLTVRNKCNGKYVPRVQNIDRFDSWQVEYLLTETPAAKAQTYYSQLLKRRKKLLDDDPTDEGKPGFYADLMRDLSKKGAGWRRARDRIDSRFPKKTVYDDDYRPGATYANRNRSTIKATPKKFKDRTVTIAAASSPSSKHPTVSGDDDDGDPSIRYQYKFIRPSSVAPNFPKKSPELYARPSDFAASGELSLKADTPGKKARETKKPASSSVISSTAAVVVAEKVPATTMTKTSTLPKKPKEKAAQASGKTKKSAAQPVTPPTAAVAKEPPAKKPSVKKPPPATTTTTKISTLEREAGSRLIMGAQTPLK